MTEKAQGSTDVEESLAVAKENELQIIQALQQLQALQRDINELGAREIENILTVVVPTERTSCAVKKPLFEKRNEAINKIPQFWAITLKNCSNLSLLFDEDEVNCFQYLTNLVVEDVEDTEETKNGLKIHFYFSDDNPYMENNVLSKSIAWNQNGERICSTSAIVWKESKSPAQDDTDDAPENHVTAFFGWLNEHEYPLSVKFLQILEIWENPLQYYLLQIDEQEGTTSDEVNKYLEDAKKYQQDINTINKALDGEIMKITSNVSEENESANKSLFDKRNEVIQAVPYFWIIALTNHSHLSLTISDEEIECLKFLTKVDVEHKDQHRVQVENQVEDVQSSMTINFYFAGDNPYFENEVISKKFFRGSEGERMCASTLIKWKPEMDLCWNIDLTKPAETTSVDCAEGPKDPSLRDSFFGWFIENSDPESNNYITLSILQVWEDPLQYYSLAEDLASRHIGDGESTTEHTSTCDENED